MIDHWDRQALQQEPEQAWKLAVGRGRLRVLMDRLDVRELLAPADVAAKLEVLEVGVTRLTPARRSMLMGFDLADCTHSIDVTTARKFLGHGIFQREMFAQAPLQPDRKDAVEIYTRQGMALQEEGTRIIGQATARLDAAKAHSDIAR